MKEVIDLYTVGEGQRLFSIIAFGASFGAVFGSYVADRLLGPVGVFELLLVGDGILIVSLMITNYVDHREKERMKTVTKEKQVEEPLGKEGGFKLVFQNKYLLFIALMILFFNLVKTTGEYLLSRTVVEAGDRLIAEHTPGIASMEEYIGKFYSSFFGAVNLLGLLAQLFLVSRIIKYMKIRGKSRCCL